MKLPSVVGLRGVVVVAAVVALAAGCSSSNKAKTTPETPDVTATPCGDGCELGVCDESTDKCVECMADVDCRADEICSKKTCIDADDAPPVVDTVCSPSSNHCSVDRGAVVTCSADGSEETAEACAADAPCTQRNGAALCADWVCSPNSFSCDGDTLLLCSDDGTEQTPFHTCDADQYCDARRALCVERVCTPGEASCDGAVLQVCNEDGSDLVDDVQCSLSEECTKEGCVPLLCEPNATFCDAGKVWKCSGSATSSEILEDCASADKFCQMHNGEAVCSDQVCYPGDSVCNAGLATTCKADGSGPKPGGDKCADNGQVCFAGQCRDQVCTPGQKLCDHGTVHLCADNGTDTTPYKNCSYNEFCESGSGSCKALICTPGLPVCYGTIKTICKDDGSGYVANQVDCRTSGEVCDNGSCVPKVCEPNSRLCVNGGTAWCNYAGSAVSQPSQCYQGSHCEAGNCIANICMPGEPACDGTIISTCNQDGSGALPGNVADDCANNGKVCSDGACAAKACEPNATFCASGNIQRCSANGASSWFLQYCLSEQYCEQTTPSAATCRDKLCVSGATGCLGEDYGTCGADGSALAAGFDDCDGAGKVCSAQGCVSSAVDTIGSTSAVQSLDTGAVAFDRVHVKTARKLTEIAAYLSLPSARTLRWTVYASLGWYDWGLVFDQVTTANGVAFHSSGPMAYTLEANKDYLIGVSVTGGTFVSYTSSTLGTQPLSFGSAVGSGSAYFNTTFSYYQSDTASLRAMRVTTTLP